jgi:hypothetical protein
VNLRTSAAFGVFAVAAALVAGPAWAEPPEHKGCFGYEAAELARSDTGAMGDHASGGFGTDLRPGPGRAGIGNVAHQFETNVSDLGFTLGTIDGDPGVCPGRP